jgi:hypothetical protein
MEQQNGYADHDGTDEGDGIEPTPAAMPIVSEKKMKMPGIV